LSAGELEAADVARRYALDTAENNPMLRPRFKVMIAWFEEHGWPRTAEIVSEFADKMRSRSYACLKIHCHTCPTKLRCRCHLRLSHAVCAVFFGRPAGQSLEDRSGAEQHWASLLFGAGDERDEER
jgi:hypothetical protein